MVGISPRISGLGQPGGAHARGSAAKLGSSDPKELALPFSLLVRARPSTPFGEGGGGFLASVSCFVRCFTQLHPTGAPYTCSWAGSGLAFCTQETSLARLWP